MNTIHSDHTTLLNIRWPQIKCIDLEVRKQICHFKMSNKQNAYKFLILNCKEAEFLSCYLSDFSHNKANKTCITESLVLPPLTHSLTHIHTHSHANACAHMHMHTQACNWTEYNFGCSWTAPLHLVIINLLKQNLFTVATYFSANLNISDKTSLPHGP